MPMPLEHKHYITPEEYLEIDRASQDVKYEYIDGHMYAMSEGTINHGQIAYNVEVLSPSTEVRDRRVKWKFYQACPSIQEYVLVNTQCQLVEVFQRQADGNIWLYQPFRPGQEVNRVSVGLKIPLAALYDLTSVPVEEEETEE